MQVQTSLGLTCLRLLIKKNNKTLRLIIRMEFCFISNMNLRNSYWPGCSENASKRQLADVESKLILNWTCIRVCH